MSNPIDETIAKLTLDNKEFERNAEQSLRTIQNVNRMMETGDGDLGYMRNAIESVSNRFSLLGNITQEIFGRIARYAVDTGEKIIRALSTDGIRDGFNEYELKMGSIQTIMAGTGESLDSVTEKLNELNTYSDKTIYSFSDMTNSIGKFTNAGVKLDDAVAAIKGVANEAALSGANANEASRAMYNFAQALSAGYVKLIDWKSIENANMATVSFKEELLKTAETLHTVEKQADGTYKVLTTNAGGSKMDDTISATKNFNDSLAYQWMTSEVLTKTLAMYADETTEIGKKATQAATEVKTWTMMIDALKEAIGSGWATTWEILIGNFDEAKELFTNINNVVGAFVDRQSQARNQLLQEWKDLGGRTSLINGFVNIFKTMKNVLAPVKEMIANLIPKVTGKDLANITKKFEEFTKRMEESTRIFSTFDFKGMYDGVVSDISNGVDQLKDAGNKAKTAFDTVYDIYLKWTGQVKTIFERQLKQKIMLGAAVAGMAAVFLKLGFSLKNAKNTLKEGFEEIVGVFSKNKVVSTVEKFLKGFNKLAGAAQIASIGYLIGSIASLLSSLSKLKDMDPEKALISIAMVGAVLKEIEIFYKQVTNISKKGKGKSLSDKIIPDFNQLLQISKMFDSLGGAVGKIATAIATLGALSYEELAKGFIVVELILNSMPRIFNKMNLKGAVVDKSVGVMMLALAALIVVIEKALVGLSKLKPEEASTAVIALGATLLEISAMMKIIEKMNPSKTAIASILILSIAIDMLSVGLKVLSTINPERMMSSAIGLGIVLMELVFAVKMLENLPKPAGILAGATAMILIASAVDIISLALAGLSMLNPEKIGISVIIIGAVLSGLSLIVHSLATIKLSQIGGVLAGAIAIVALASAVDIIALALAGLSMLNPEKLALSVIILTATISALTLTIHSLSLIKMGQIPGLIAGVIGILGLVTALDMVTLSLATLSLVDPVKLAASVLAIASVMAALVIAVKYMDGAHSIRGGITMLLVAGSVVAIALALLPLTMVDVNQLLGAVIGLSAILATLVIVVNMMEGAGSIVGGGVMVMLSASIVMLVGALTLLGTLDMGTIMAGVLGIALLLGELGIALNLMTLALPGAAALLIASAALVVMGYALEGLASSAAVMYIGPELCSFLLDLAVGLAAMTIGIVGAPALLMASIGLKSLAEAIQILGNSNIYMVSDYIEPVLQAVSSGLKQMKGCLGGAITLLLAAPSLGMLADSLKKFKGIPMTSLGPKLQELLIAIAKGVKKMTFGLGGAITLAATAAALLVLAEAAKQFKSIKMGKLHISLTNLFKSISEGLKEIKGTKKGAESLKIAAPAIQKLAKAAKALDGLSDLSKAGKNLKSILKSVSEATQGLNGGESGAKALATLGPALKDIFAGVKQLNKIKINENFGTELKKIFSSINSAVREFSELDDGSSYIGIDVLSRIGKPIKDFAKGVLELSKFSSYNDPGDILRKTLGPLSDYLPKLTVDNSAVTTFEGVSKSLKTFAKGVGELNKFSSHNDPGDMIRRTMGALVDYMPKLQGQESSVKVFSTISSSLTGFAKGMGELNKFSSHNDPGEVIRRTMGALVDYIPKLQGYESGAKSFNIIADKLKALAKGIGELVQFSSYNDPGDILRKTLGPLTDYLPAFKDSGDAATSMAKIADKLKNLADGIKALNKISSMNDPGDMIRKTFGAITDYLPKLGGSKEFTSIADKLKTLATGMTALTKVPNTTDPGDMMRKTFGAISDYTGKLGDTTNLSAVNDLLPTLATNMTALTQISGYNDPGEAIRKTLGAISDYLPGLAGSAEGVVLLGNVVESLTKISTFATNISGVGPEVMGNSLRAVGTGLETIIGAITDNSSAHISDFSVALNTFYDAMEKLANLSSSWSEPVITGLQTLMSTSISDTLQSELKLAVESVGLCANEMRENGALIAANLADGIDKNTDKVDNAVTAMTKILKDEIKSSMTKVISIAKSETSKLGSSWSAAIRNAIGTVTSSARSATVSMGYTLQASANQSGIWFGQGFANGIISQLSNIANAGKRAGEAAYNALKRAIQQGSPSKKTIASGEFYGEGFVIGIVSLYDKIRGAAAGLGQVANDALNENLNTNPAITPVLNTDSLDGYSWINGGLSLDMSGMYKVQKQLDPISATITEIQNKMVDAYTKLNESVTEMANKLDEYANRPQPETAIYMNSRKVASSTAKDMNVELGKLARRKVR